MRVGLLTEGGYPYVDGEARLWCDRLVRGLGQHEFHVYALSRSAHQEALGRCALPPQVRGVRSAALWGEASGRPVRRGRRRAGRRFAESFGELAAAVCAEAGQGAAPPPEQGAGEGSAAMADRFGSGLYGLADLARDTGPLAGALRSEAAVAVLERACRAPGASRAARAARVPDLLAVAAELERLLRPLSLDWYGDDALGAVDLCHATSAGAAALPGLLAGHFAGVPLLVTEYGVRLRAHYLAGAGAGAGAGVGAGGFGGGGFGTGGFGTAEGFAAEGSGGGAAGPGGSARALVAALHGRLATETYRRAAVVTSGSAHARRWQERCGADRAKLRTVPPGLDAERFAEVGEREGPGAPDTLLWAGRIEPAKDLVSLLHAFAEVREAVPAARLRVVGTAADGPRAPAYLAHCRELAAQLFPAGPGGAGAAGAHPVSFEETGGPEAPGLADVYAAAGVVVLSSVAEGFPVGLVEAMLCGRATVSTDVGAVVEVVGGTGLVVPPRDPRALAQACVALLRDPARRARLGAAARARALELFTAEQNVAAFHAMYLEIVSRCPVRREAVDEAGAPVPFGHPAEASVPGRWTAGRGSAAPYGGAVAASYGSGPVPGGAVGGPGAPAVPGAHGVPGGVPGAPGGVLGGPVPAAGPSWAARHGLPGHLRGAAS
ncbi:glycosyltransferase [Streptomyces sp. CC224B]|uniref:glycosyltransferase n=1 Tax=Streptomyces sp. CC224B TaxID=3044571 RepID=UPI0024A820F0|nr:glycosyltransferase [Streptomyces sp. CC224B]